MNCKQAEEFHKKAQQLLDWLAEAERQLRYKGSIPDEEALILQQLEEHKVRTLFAPDTKDQLKLLFISLQKTLKDWLMTLKDWLKTLKAG